MWYAWIIPKPYLYRPGPWKKTVFYEPVPGANIMGMAAVGGHIQGKAAGKSMWYPTEDSQYLLWPHSILSKKLS